MVVMCANRPRLNHFEKLIMELEDCCKCGIFHKKINIWIDEADSNLQLWSSYLNVISKDIINIVTLVSATFDPVFKKYGRLAVIGDRVTCAPCYRCLRDSDIIRIDYVGNLNEYIIHIFEKFPELINPGMKSFIPGNFFKASHESIANLLVTNYNFVVLIINGENKQFLIPGKKSIDINEYYTDDDSFSEVLSRIYIENKFYNYPFAITGLGCVKRGMTFQSPDFLFDYGIIPPISKNTEAYQLMARLFGNIGDFPGYKACKIFSTSNNFNKIQKQESMAINIARLVAEQMLENIGKEELMEAINMGINYGNGSKPIVIIKLPEIKKWSKVQIINIIKNYDSDLYNEYSNYKTHIWNMDTPAKCTKWGLARMKIGHAHSTSVCVHKDEIKEDILMIYIHENELFLSPWNGTSQ